MNTKFIWLSITAVIISFIGGFLFANALNRSEVNRLRAEKAQPFKSEAGQPQNRTETTLSDEEIRNRISEADQNPSNTAFQKNLGLALYRYAAMKQDPELLSEVARLLTRAYESNPKDYDVLVALGNAFFDIGYLRKENAGLIKSREFYNAALDIKPEDVDVRTDLGLTFYLVKPPETEKAIAEFKKSLEDNPKHEKTLQVTAQAYLTEKNTAEAETYLKRLEAVNPANPYLAELKKQAEQSLNAEETK